MEITPEALDPIGAVEKRIALHREPLADPATLVAAIVHGRRREATVLRDEIIIPREALVSELARRARAAWDAWDNAIGRPGQEGEFFDALAEILEHWPKEDG